MGVPAYLLSRGAIGNTGALFVMLVIMLPAFMMAMYEKDGLPFEKVLRNIVRSRILWPRTRPYKTENFYAYLMNVRKEDAQLARHKTKKTPGKTGRR